LAGMYTPDAYVLPAGAEMAKGHNAIEKFWGGAVKQLGDAKLTTVDVQSLGPGAAREIGTFSFKTKAQPPEQVTICRRVAEDGRAVAARHGHLEHEQIAGLRDNRRARQPRGRQTRGMS
jgi:ketosteroid isomerase-like protein